MDWLDFFIGAGLISSGVLLWHCIRPDIRSLRRQRRSRAGTTPAVAPEPLSAIEDLVATKKWIREDEASRWVAEWMRASGATDKWETAHEIRELAYEAQRQARLQQNRSSR